MRTFTRLGDKTASAAETGVKVIGKGGFEESRVDALFSWE